VAVSAGGEAAGSVDRDAEGPHDSSKYSVAFTPLPGRRALVQDSEDFRTIQVTTKDAPALWQHNLDAEQSSSKKSRVTKQLKM
jgi:hypothetical protein